MIMYICNINYLHFAYAVVITFLLNIKNSHYGK